MLINLQEILSMAEKTNSAIGSYNVYNLETILAIKEAANLTKQPAIIAFGESYISHSPIKVISNIVHTLFEDSSIPIALHLDHAKDFDIIAQAIDCGFTSVMYDGSRLPLTENIDNTKKIIELAHYNNVSVEGELGYLNNEDGSGHISQNYTSIDDAINYTQSTQVDALAIAIGNAHGLYKSKPNLNFKQLIKLNHVTPCPLVLHGSSGISNNDLIKAITLGIRKFNINTEISTTAVQATREFLASNPFDINPNLRFENVLKNARLGMTNKIIEYMKIFANKEDIS